MFEKNFIYELYMDNLFKRMEDDEKFGLFVNDRVFLEIMSFEFKKDKDGFWIVLLLFKLNC